MEHVNVSLQSAGILLLTLIAYVTSRVLYNIFLHPLRSFPGPLTGRASVIPHQRALLGGESHRRFQALHQRYGPVVRFAPNHLSFIDPQTWKDVYGHRATAFEKDKQFYGPDIFGAERPGLIRADNVSHARQRKLVSHAFSDKALREQESLLKSYATLLVKKIKEATAKSTDGKVDLVKWYNFTTFDIMADLAFGEPLKLLEESEYTPWVRSFLSSIKLITLSSIMRAWPAIEALLALTVPADMKAKRKAHLKFSTDRVDQRMARKTDRPDIWTYVLRHDETEDGKLKGLSQTELHSNGGLFMVAGTETSATELSGMTYYLLKDPQRMARLKKEVRDAFPTYEDMTMTKLHQLEYLGAVIEEGLRIYPPVPIGLPRVAPKGGAQVCGYMVPGGTQVQFPHYAAYHSETNFKQPENFIPERWLPEGQEEYSSDRREVVNAFSFGPRNCIGKNLAHHEMRLILASILWNFDLELFEESGEKWTDQKMYTLWEKPPMLVKLRSIRD